MSRLAVAFLLVACGLTNPVAKHPDGTASKLRIGVASVRLIGDCDGPEEDCAVKLSMAHANGPPQRVEIAAVHVLFGGVDVGALPIADVKHASTGIRTTQLSIAIDRVDWHELLPLHDWPPPALGIRVHVELVIDAEPVIVRSMFEVEHMDAPLHLRT